MAQTKEERNAKQRAYRATRREATRANARAYVERKRELYREASRAYEARNKEARNARQRADHAIRRDERNAYNRAYKAAHPEISQHYSATHRDEIVSHHHTYRAQKNGCEGRHTATEWRALCDWFGNRCCCCGCEGKLTRDHVLPIICGGSNDISNLQPLCRACNGKKYQDSTDFRDPVLLAQFLESLANE